MKSRTIANEVYLPVIQELLEAGEEVPLTVSGNSMSPFFVHARDRVLLMCAEGKLRKGDIVLFQRKNGQYILHRICRVSDKEQYYLIGDAQTVVEGPIEREQIFGKVKAVYRKDRWLKPGNFWWEFFEHIWIRVIPLRRFICRIYSVFKHIK